jgi:putative transposase
MGNLRSFPMARLPRYLAPELPLHIVQRGNDRQTIHLDDADQRSFRTCLADAASRHGLAIHAYVSMSNHFHLLATPTHASSVAKTLQSVGRRYVWHFNQRYGRTGSLWEGRYHATVIDSERYLFACFRYIELNPVRAGIVADPGAYRWSSHRHNAHGEPDSLVTPHPLYQALDRSPINRRQAYRALFDEALRDELIQDIRTATQKGWALGDRDFQRRVAALTQRRAAPMTRGRKSRSSDRQGRSLWGLSDVDSSLDLSSTPR